MTASTSDIADVILASDVIPSNATVTVQDVAKIPLDGPYAGVELAHRGDRVFVHGLIDVTAEYLAWLDTLPRERHVTISWPITGDDDA